MGGSLSSSDSSSEQGGTFNQSVWNPGAIQEMQSQFNQMFPQTLSSMQQMQPGATQQMQGVFDQSQPAWQQQMGGGAYQGMDLQNQYNQALQGGGAEQDIDTMIMGGQGNDYVDAMKQQMQSDAFDRLGAGFSNIDQRAASGGMGGSSRHGILQSNLMENEMDRLGDMQTQLGASSFDKDLDRKLGIAQRADQFDMQKLQNIGQQLGAQQGAMSGGLDFGKNMQTLGMGQYSPTMMPWQAGGAYANAMGSPTVLGSGSSYGESDADSFGVSGGVGGGK